MRNIPTGSAGGYGFGLAGPVPRDVWLLLGIVFTTFSISFFAATAPLSGALRLTSAAWKSGFLWQLVSYPFVGTGAPGIWFVVELIILFLFARTVFYQLGRRKFWQFLVALALAAALAAVAVDVVGSLVTGRPWQAAFVLMQGQRMLLVLLVALFSVLNRNATILLFFVLPVQAKWFLLLEIVFAFLGFLGTKDLPGFVGICTAVGLTVAYFSRAGGSGIFDGALRELWLRAQAAWFRFRLGRMKQKRGMRIVPTAKDNDDYVH